MGHAWEQRDEASVDATVEQVWEAIATGPGIDSWFMGRSQVQPGPDGSVSTDMGGFAMNSAITSWEPSRRFGYRGEGPDGRFIAFEYLIEGRDQSSTVLRLVASGFLPGDDWEDEFDAMLKGGQMYFRTLVAYLNHFAGRNATPISVSGPRVGDWVAAWTTLRDALGVSATPKVGDPVRVAVPGLVPIGGEIDFVNPHALGIRTDDALYRFIQGFFGSMVLGHHLFAEIDEQETTRAWQAWLNGLYA